MRTLCLATLLSLAACGSPSALSVEESAATEARAQSLRADIEQAQRELAELAAARPSELDDPTRPQPQRDAIRVAWKSEQGALQAKIVRLRLQLEALTGERLPPINVG